MIPKNLDFAVAQQSWISKLNLDPNDLKSIEMQLEKKKQHPDIVSIITRTTSITLGLKHSFSTGYIIIA